MNITKGQFRWLVTAFVMVLIMGVVASLAGESSLPTPLRDYLRERSEVGAAGISGRDMVLIGVAIPLLIAAFVSFIGLYCFWRFARPLTVVVVCVGLCLYPLAGPVVESAWASLLFDLGNLLTGAIVALMYASPVSAWFAKRHVC